VLALETGAHTGWLGRLLSELGHEVVVANARKVRAIWADERKSDWRDAETLARLVRTDRALLRPVSLRSAQAQADQDLLRARDGLVKARTQLVCVVRSLVKHQGLRLPKGGTEAFARRAREELEYAVVERLEGVLGAIEALGEQIRRYDRRIAQVAEERYAKPVAAMTQVTGVGTLTAMAIAVAVERPERFRPARQFGAYVGLTPRRDQSGEMDKQLGITHAGNEQVRRLLVSSAQYILGPFGPDCTLRRFGLRLAARGGKAAKKRAVVAVARKLGVLLLKLWQSGELYEPLRERSPAVTAA
jgi:transposase